MSIPNHILSDIAAYSNLNLNPNKNIKTNIISVISVRTYSIRFHPYFYGNQAALTAHRRTRGFELHVLSHGGACAHRTDSRAAMAGAPARSSSLDAAACDASSRVGCLTDRCRHAVADLLSPTRLQAAAPRIAHLQRAAALRQQGLPELAGSCVTARPWLAHFYFYSTCYYLSRRPAALLQTPSISRGIHSPVWCHHSRPTTHKLNS